MTIRTKLNDLGNSMWKPGQTVTIRTKRCDVACRVMKATNQLGRTFGDNQREGFNLQGKLPKGCYLTTNWSIYKSI